jgi:hypothetical protein
MKELSIEDKESLLKDLCARLPYGVYISPVDCGKAILIGIKDGNPLLWDTIHKKEYDKPWDIEYIKPYLRPMSSMTEEEKEFYASMFLEYDGGRFTEFPGTVVDWLNKNMFDYNGLIPMGLALEAKEGMYD